MYQFFAPLAEPIGAIWLLMVVAVIWLAWRRHWQSAIWLGLPTIVLFILASTSLAEMLVATEEKPWAEKSKSVLSSLSDKSGPAADAVVALGGGGRVSQNDMMGFAVEEGGSRLLTAVQLVRLGKAKTLVLGGSWPMPGKVEVPSMVVVQDWVIAWGLAGSSVTNLGICINTHDEALAFGRLARSRGWMQVILVTSAMHMRRSVCLFNKQGIKVVPVASDFRVQGVSQSMPFSLFPRQRRLFLLALYMHEKIGWWVYWLRGWV